mmetsp:Transcript_9398/g.31248  ORF Transcript_9398/g.31248 Transcript_9398/m.31248 type:complete len:229 (+) Transcript_9398:575-1261(+)
MVPSPPPHASAPVTESRTTQVRRRLAPPASVRSRSGFCVLFFTDSSPTSSGNGRKKNILPSTRSNIRMAHDGSFTETTATTFACATQTVSKETESTGSLKLNVCVHCADWCCFFATRVSSNMIFDESPDACRVRLASADNVTIAGVFLSPPFLFSFLPKPSSTSTVSIVVSVSNKVTAWQNESSVVSAPNTHTHRINEPRSCDWYVIKKLVAGDDDVSSFFFKNEVGV